MDRTEEADLVGMAASGPVGGFQGAPQNSEFLSPYSRMLTPGFLGSSRSGSLALGIAGDPCGVCGVYGVVWCSFRLTPHHTI